MLLVITLLIWEDYVDFAFRYRVQVNIDSFWTRQAWGENFWVSFDSSLKLSQSPPASYETCAEAWAQATRWRGGVPAAGVVRSL